MSVTLYFSRININSSQIFDIYDNRDRLDEILKLLYSNIKDDLCYTQKDIRSNENKEEFLYEAFFKLKSIQKYNDFTVAGNIIKKSNLFVNRVNEETGEINKYPVENSEVVPFYFDVLHEIVVFHTTNRFGFNEFNHAFKELLKESMSKESEEYNFKVELDKKGLSINKLQSQLRNAGKLRTLKIEIIPPNPDDDLLDKIQQDGEEYLNDIKRGNITQKSTIFTSISPDGLNIDSKIVKNELNEINDIHSKLSSEEAIKNGYVTVEATNTKGRMYSTNDNKPTKYQLKEKPESLREFVEISKQKILAIIGF